tara:strand:+ start:2247 stop:2534 length:288 start_codon:yes stop_codon:yes gene_type:complete
MDKTLNTNYKVNDEYTLDNSHRRLFKALQENRKNERERLFQNWLFTELDDVIVEDVLNIFSENVIKSIKKKGFKIKIKPFRDEMATLIYYNSYTQ